MPETQPDLEQIASSLNTSILGLLNSQHFGVKMVDWAANGWSYMGDVPKGQKVELPEHEHLQFLRVNTAYDRYGNPIKGQDAVYCNTPNNIGVPQPVLEEAQKYQAMSPEQKKEFLLNVHQDLTQKSGPYSQRLEQEEALIGPVLRYFADHLREQGLETEARAVFYAINSKYPSLLQLEDKAQSALFRSDSPVCLFDSHIQKPTGVSNAAIDSLPAPSTHVQNVGGNVYAPMPAK